MDAGARVAVAHDGAALTMATRDPRHHLAGPRPSSVSLADDGGAPTELELQALRLYLELGSIKRVAHRLRVGEQEIKRKMMNIRAKVGATTTAEAVYLLHDRIGTLPKDG